MGCPRSVRLPPAYTKSRPLDGAIRAEVDGAVGRGRDAKDLLVREARDHAQPGPSHS